jgi:hypothetical protein
VRGGAGLRRGRGCDRRRRGSTAVTGTTARRAGRQRDGERGRGQHGRGLQGGRTARRRAGRAARVARRGVARWPAGPWRRRAARGRRWRALERWKMKWCSWPRG